MFSLVVSFALVLRFDVQVQFTNTRYSTMRFFVLVTFVAFVTAAIIFIMNITRCVRTFPMPWHWVNLVFGVVFSLFLVLASALLTGSLREMKGHTDLFGRRSGISSQCAYLDRTKSQTTCTAIEASVGFGFICVVLFVVDILVSGHKLKQGDSSADTSLPQNVVDNLTVSTVIAI